MTEDDHTKEKTGAELLNNQWPVPIRYKGIHSQPGGQENGSLISVFCHLQTVGPSSGRSSYFRRKKDVNCDKPHFFCLGGGLQKKIKKLLAQLNYKRNISDQKVKLLFRNK